MKKIHSLLKLAWEVALLGSLVFVLIFAIHLTRRTLSLSPQAATEYPPPQESPRAFPTQVMVTNTPKPTLEPFEATQYALKDNHTPSPSEIAAQATYFAEMATIDAQLKLYTPPPPPTPVYYPVNSIADMPNVVFNDPFFGNVNNGDFGFCLKANQPSEALLIKSLNKKESPDYYMLPFFEDGKLCSLYEVDLIDHMGTVGGWSSASGTKYPPVSADEAKRLVETTIGLSISDGPYLGFRLLRESMDPYHPFWVVTTTDGQTYYVIYGYGINEDNSVLDVRVWNATEVHPINP
jgi:hypothetical protein